MTITMNSLISEVKSGDVERVKRILHRGNIVDTINYQDVDRRETALFCACARGYLTIVQLLLSFKARLDLYTIWGGTPLHAAAENGHENIVRLLVENKANINAQTHYGDTALHLAAYRGHVNVVKILVETGADTTLRNVKYNRPIEEAGIHKHHHIVNYLTEYEKTKERASLSASAAVPCVPVSVECYTPCCQPTYMTSQPRYFGNGESLHTLGEIGVNDLSKDEVDWGQNVGFNSNIPIADGIPRWQEPVKKTVCVTDSVPSQKEFLKIDDISTDRVSRREPVECDEPIADRIHRRREPVESLDPTAVPKLLTENLQDTTGNISQNYKGLVDNDRWKTNLLIQYREELTGVRVNLDQTRNELERCLSMQQHTYDKVKYIRDKHERFRIREHDLLMKIRKLELN